MKKVYPLLLVRHAEAEHHVQDLTGGWTNSHLTERGREQAELLARRLHLDLAGAPLYLGCSPLNRAVQTAEILGKELGLQLQLHPELTDINNGLAAGMSRTAAKEIAIPPSEPIVDWQPYPDAESWRQLWERVTGFIDRFTASLQSPAVLVSHAVTIHVIVAWWLGLDVESQTHFGLTPASLTVLRTTSWNERSLERLNDTAHLYAAGMGDKIRAH